MQIHVLNYRLGQCSFHKAGQIPYTFKDSKLVLKEVELTLPHPSKP